MLGGFGTRGRTTESGTNDRDNVTKSAPAAISGGLGSPGTTTTPGTDLPEAGSNSADGIAISLTGEGDAVRGVRRGLENFLWGCDTIGLGWLDTKDRPGMNGLDNNGGKQLLDVDNVVSVLRGVEDQCVIVVVVEIGLFWLVNAPIFTGKREQNIRRNI
ncbi:hypothetical protein B0H10DRAFT_1940690 [Mycena sp. CBHHK59/15]|nr:hypothetical protein B0H10DRAFT_1940690 [Mycena sp. CBHHK59/15]